MIRAPTSQEITQLKRSFHRWGVFAFMESQKVLINYNRTTNQREILVTTEASLDMLEKANLQPKEVGLSIGQIRNKKFIPSLPGAEIIAKHSIAFPYVVVNRIGEALVLYGRDIFGDSIIEVSKNLNQNQAAIILNQDRESIGIGQTRFSEDNLFKKGVVTVYTLLDAGIYLRNQGE
jgi:60S ribosome subunit biogenesis protein NIP7